MKSFAQFQLNDAKSVLTDMLGTVLHNGAVRAVKHTDPDIHHDDVGLMTGNPFRYYADTQAVQ